MFRDPSGWLLSLLVVVALSGLVVSCGDGTGSGEPVAGTALGPAIETHGTQALRAEARLEHLQALPYVDLDAGADKRLRGVTLYDRERASPGYNLHTDYINKVYLTDLSGELVHRWTLPIPYRRCEHALVLQDGGALVVCHGLGLARLDWESRVLWEIRMAVHHDIALRPDGSILVPFHARHDYRNRQVLFDYLQILSTDGRLLDRWSSFERLDELRAHHEPSPLDTLPGPGPDPVPDGPEGVDYYHLNAVEVLSDTPLGRRDRRFRSGNILISLRNTSTIAVLDQEDFSVQWSWGPGVLEFQHMPTMLESGNILIFDNGTYRQWSRVVELDPASGRIVWEYRGDPPESFYSEWRGSSQRLPNGNTLICEAERGHAFEVTPVGEMVWELWNPEFEGDKRRRIYRLLREPTRKIDALLATHSGSPGGARGASGR